MTLRSRVANTLTQSILKAINTVDIKKSMKKQLALSASK